MNTLLTNNIIPVYQTKFSNKELGTNGNCMRACFATIFNIDIESMPHYEDMGDEWADEVIDLFEKNGFDVRQILNGEAPADTSKIYLGIIKTTRNADINHLVVMRDGEIIHDPHPEAVNYSITEWVGYWIITPILSTKNNE